jgi:hypothetical protein
LCLRPDTGGLCYFFPLALAVRIGYDAGAGFVVGAGISFRRGSRQAAVCIYNDRTGRDFGISGAYVGIGIIRAAV